MPLVTVTHVIYKCFSSTVYSSISLVCQPPDAATVRPQAVLEEAMKQLVGRWTRGEVDYVYACSQLKAIRQDLVVRRSECATLVVAEYRSGRRREGVVQQQRSYGLGLGRTARVRHAFAKMRGRLESYNVSTSKHCVVGVDTALKFCDARLKQKASPIGVQRLRGNVATVDELPRQCCQHRRRAVREMPITAMLHFSAQAGTMLVHCRTPHLLYCPLLHLDVCKETNKQTIIHNPPGMLMSSGQQTWR